MKGKKKHIKVSAAYPLILKVEVQLEGKDYDELFRKAKIGDFKVKAKIEKFGD